MLDVTDTSSKKTSLFGKVYNSLFRSEPSPLTTQIIDNTPPYQDHTSNDSLTSFNTYHNSSSAGDNGYSRITDWLGRNRDPYKDDMDDLYEDTRSHFSNSSRRSSMLAPPLTPRRYSREYSFDDIPYGDEETRFQHTMSLIDDSLKRRSAIKTEVPGTFPDNVVPVAKNRSSDSSTVDLIGILQKNNAKLQELAHNVDVITRKSDLKSLLKEKRELEKQFADMRKEYEQELDTSKKVYDDYCQLVEKYRDLKRLYAAESRELNKLKNSQDLEQLEEENKRLYERNKSLEDELRTTRTRVDDQLLEASSQYDQLKSEYHEKSMENRKLLSKIEELTNTLQKPALAMPESPSQAALRNITHRAREELYPLIHGDDSSSDTHRKKDDTMSILRSAYPNIDLPETVTSLGINNDWKISHPRIDLSTTNTGFRSNLSP
ncbi:hypothetical protein CANARDRAFT_168213 [[Candida] arabinofermentans NRRL YB-2248]|uniref:Spindle pole body component Bbp1 C-terminal domain-containing protein n=1 Tax=[Candida] arabinofermentans NRRL YB-2248 TaxID=983967 RepID=A0A1E4SZP0_9ASCO|nr:hypothetical protein CANARDRAFT_168213 [[Candida] arabinofermentans NRRL YB-2248]